MFDFGGHEDYDDYTEPQPAELSGPVGPARRRTPHPRITPPQTSVQRVPLLHAVVYARPHRTGPPA